VTSRNIKLNFYKSKRAWLAGGRQQALENAHWERGFEAPERGAKTTRQLHAICAEKKNLQSRPIFLSLINLFFLKRSLVG
jgi:hypothetical protein